MRVTELVQGRQKHSIQHFVKPALEASRKPGQRTDQKLLTASVNNPMAVAQVPKKELPLFMEPLFKARDFDPL